MEPKDRNDPKTGRTHAPGRKIPPLEKYLPDLLPKLKEICDKQIARLRRKRSPTAATAKGPTTTATPAATTTATTSTAAATPAAATPATASKAPQQDPANTKGKKKKKKKKSAKAQQRDDIEKELDQYIIIESEAGIIIEDKYGVPLIILVRQAIPPELAEQLNVCLFFFRMYMKH